MVFIGVNYVTFVSGYYPSANLSVVVWCFIAIQQNFSVRLYVKNDFARAILTCYRSVGLLKCEGLGFGGLLVVLMLLLTR